MHVAWHYNLYSLSINTEVPIQKVVWSHNTIGEYYSHSQPVAATLDYLSH